MTKKPKIMRVNIRLFLAIGLSVTAFLVCITAFVMMYDGLRREPLIIQLISSEKSEQKAKTEETNFNLMPWDAHIVKFIISPESILVGKTLVEIGMREKFGITIVLIERGKKKIHVPSRNEYI